MLPDPRNAAAPGENTEGNEQITEQEIDHQDRRTVKSTIDYAAVIDCPMSCSLDRRSCPWECPRIGGAA